jgi:hypothetical protein
MRQCRSEQQVSEQQEGITAAATLLPTGLTTTTNNNNTNATTTQKQQDPAHTVSAMAKQALDLHKGKPAPQQPCTPPKKPSWQHHCKNHELMTHPSGGGVTKQFEAIPTQQTEETTINATRSLTMMKNIVRTGISEVCYLRGIFDESSFQSKAIHGKGGDKKDGVTVHVLKTKDQDNDEAQLVMDWLQHGVYEAMDKEYLRAITVGSRR